MTQLTACSRWRGSTAITSGGTPLSLHIYKAGSGPMGLLSNDQVVKADDKETVL